MRVVFTILSMVLFFSVYAQPIPSKAESFEFFVTFGKQAESSWGDDDYNQTVFFLIPKHYRQPFYIRVFDPDVGGQHDEMKQVFDTYTRFSLFGGKGAHSNEAARNVNPVPGYDSGKRIYSKTFSQSPQYDNKYFVMGPFNPLDGEYDEVMGGYIFKVIVEGVKGDDGNLYNFFLSSQSGSNRKIDGANAFTYEYALRLKSDGTVSHLYPFIDGGISSIILYNFDYDKDGEIFVYTVAKNRHLSAVSGDDEWKKGVHKISSAEHNSSMDVQLLNKKGINNNLTVYVLNQYEDAVGFFSSPIGGVPKYRYKVKINLTD